MKAWTILAIAFAGLLCSFIFGAGGRYTLSTPTNVQAVPGKAKIDVSWDSVSMATSYDVYRLTTGAFYTVVANVSGTTYQDTAVTNGQLTGYKIVAKNATDSSSQSSPAVTTPNIPASTLTATPAKASMDLSWSAQGYADKYNVYRGAPGNWTTIASNVVGTTYTDTGRTNGATYNYVVRGVNDAGPGLESNVATATVVLPPTTLTGTSGKASSILNWSSIAYADSYAVYRWIGYWDTVASGLTTTTYTHANRGNGQSYQYMVQGYNSGGYGQSSNTATVDVYLPAPTGVKAVKNPSTNVVTVSWNAVTWADSYQVYRSTSSGTGFSFYNSTTSTSLNGGTASGSTVYYYIVYAYNSGGLSPKSQEVNSGPPASGARPPHEGQCPLDPDVCKCMDPSTGGVPIQLSTTFDALAGDPVNLASGAEIFQPAADLKVYNPNGPSVVFQRNYRSNLAKVGYFSPGLSPGWCHTYDIRIVPTASTSSWDNLTLVYPNSAVETLSPTLSMGSPTGAFSYTNGLPYVVSGVASGTTNQWTSIDLTWRDQTVWRFTLNSTGDYALTRITNRMGKYITLNWDSSRKLTTVVDGTSSATLLTCNYDGNGVISSIVDFDSRKVAFGSTFFSGSPVIANASVVVASAATSWTTRAAYVYTAIDSRFYLNTITVPSPTGTGTETGTINYDSNGKVTSRVDANGNKRVYTYNSGSTVVAIKDSSNNTVLSWTQKYSASNRATGKIDSSSNEDFWEFNDSNNPAKPTRFLTKTGKEYLAAYDTKGNMTSETWPSGIVTAYTWDYTNFVFGRLTSVQQTGKAATTFTYYEPSGLLATVTSPRPGGGTAVTMTFTYDALGNVLTATTPGNGTVSSKTTTYNYSTDGAYSQTTAFGQPLFVEDNLGHKTHYRYDSQGRVTATWDHLGNETDRTFNLAGDVLTEVNPATGQTGGGHSYKENVYLYVGGPQVTDKWYDESGSLSRTRSTTYGKDGELLTVSGGGESATYTYDAAYRLKTLADGLSQTTTYSYNSLGFVSQISYPGGATLQFTSYDGEGKVLQRIDPNGVTANLTYGGDMGELTSIAYPAASTYNVTYDYDDYGRLETMTDSTGVTAYTYGDVDELLTKATTFTGLSAKTISYTYNEDGSRATMVTPAGTFTYGYDGAGRVTSVANPFSETTSWTYLNNDWLDTQTLGNGSYTAYTYNAMGQLTQLENRKSNNTLLSSFGSAAYNGVGNMTSITASITGASSYSGTTNWTYDTKDQMTQEQSARLGSYTNNFGYDAAGNPTTFKGTSQSFNSRNQHSGTGFAYDSNGNPTTYKGDTLTFDPEDHMISYGSVLTAGYSGDGRRAWKQGASRTYFLYDEGAIVCELDATGAVIATNTWGGNGLVSRNDGTNSVFYTFDQRGATVQRLDASEVVLTSHAADAFGVTASSSATTDPWVGMGAQSGYYTDVETGLQILTFRYYDGATGRFITRDPIGSLGGINLYSYVGSNPINGSDPLGLYHLYIWIGKDGLGCGSLYADPGDFIGMTKDGRDKPFFGRGGELLGTYVFSNRPAGKHKPFPDGTWRVTDIEHGRKMGPDFLVFRENQGVASDRTTWVHSGRGENWKARTLGCVRGKESDVNELAIYYRLGKYYNPKQPYLVTVSHAR